MALTHHLGFPRIGAKRELKFALESFWAQKITSTELNATATTLRSHHWQQQSGLDFTTVGDFSLYDQVLDMSFTLGNIPKRARFLEGDAIDHYFRVARGRSPKDKAESVIHAGEMTKWFDTNYHYIVPEFYNDTGFSLNASRLEAQIEEAQQHAPIDKIKPVIIGPATYLYLGKSKDGSNKLDRLEALLLVYKELLTTLKAKGIEWVQIDEPILVTELDQEWANALELAYHRLQGTGLNVLLATYFSDLQNNLRLACNLPVQGLHLDAVNAQHEVRAVVDWLPSHKVLSLGVINGRNIWKTPLTATLDWLEPVYQRLQERLWLAPSCSLLHVPVDLQNEEKLSSDIKSWLAFAVQKLEELKILSTALVHGRESVAIELNRNTQALVEREQSQRIHKPAVKAATQTIDTNFSQRGSVYAIRASKQQAKYRFPAFPTTTIGSFPQTAAIRQTRKQYKNQEISKNNYTKVMCEEIELSVREQERLNIDVLVHGEAERNDMVEYFGEQLQGYAFTEFAWVQSYGSRCVKPPIIYGDIVRENPMTVEWSQYAQSLTDKPMKGMLTGPVTLLNWSFVRDDQPRADTCRQLALAIRAEVQDLEAAGIGIIQIDEPALREGLPLKQKKWAEYLAWAVRSFQIAASGVSDETQIHTHMCYSEFNDIIQAIADLDADVITIETSRSDMELLDVFDEFNYPNGIGPGVYDIHTPNTPAVDQMVRLLQRAAKKIPAERLWVNPDCGLKTRTWGEAIPALKNMVKAAELLRQSIGDSGVIEELKKAHA